MLKSKAGKTSDKKPETPSGSKSTKSGGKESLQQQQQKLQDFKYDDPALKIYEGDLQLVCSAMRLNDIVDKGAMFDAQDPMVRMTVGNVICETERQKDAGRNAIFSEKFTFQFPASKYRGGLELKVEVLNKSILGTETFLGGKSVPVRALLSKFNDTDPIKVVLPEGGTLSMKGNLSPALRDTKDAVAAAEDGNGNGEIDDKKATYSKDVESATAKVSSVAVATTASNSDTENAEEQFYCQLCSMAFKSSAFLDRHLKFSDLHARNSSNSNNNNNNNNNNNE